MDCEQEWRYEPTFTPIASYDGIDVETMEVGYGSNEIVCFPIGKSYKEQFTIKEGDKLLTNTDRKIEHPIWNLYKKEWVKRSTRKQKEKPGY